MKRIAVIDYGAGNLHNVCAALKHLGVDAVVAQQAQQLSDADAVVFPGVGVWGSAVSALQEKGLWTVMLDAAREKPFLGICLGMQLLFESSEESPGVPGLGLLSGMVKRLPSQSGQRHPSIGWRRLRAQSEDCGAWTGRYMYFVHGYHAVPTQSEVVCATYDYGGVPVVAAVRQGHVMGTQFHPEKSGEDGLRWLTHWLERIG